MASDEAKKIYEEVQNYLEDNPDAVPEDSSDDDKMARTTTTTRGKTPKSPERKKPRATAGVWNNTSVKIKI